MSNTIAGCALTAVAQETLPAYQSLFAPLRGIITDFSSDVAAEGATVTSRYPTKPTAADVSGGYSASDVTLTTVTINMTTMYGFVYHFHDYERTRSAVNLNDIFIQPSAQALGDKIFGDIWDLVTASNFSTATSAIAKANFDREDVVDIGTTLTEDLYAPKIGRSIYLAPGHYGSLVKGLLSAEWPGQTTNKAEGLVPRIAGFDVYESNDCDATESGLVGFAFHRSALCIAARRIDASGAAADGCEVEDIVIPGLNFPIQLRRWYDSTLGALNYSVACLYGVSKGTGMGVRIVES